MLDCGVHVAQGFETFDNLMFAVGTVRWYLVLRLFMAAICVIASRSWPVVLKYWKIQPSRSGQCEEIFSKAGEASR